MRGDIASENIFGYRGAGFIGSNYINYMLKKYGESIRIINLDKLTYAGNLENLKEVETNKNYTFCKRRYL